MLSRQTSPIPEKLPFPTPPGLKILRRVTLFLTDSAQNWRFPDLQKEYDIVAIRPTNEASFAAACQTLDCDLISLDFTSRLPFVLKFKTVSAACQRGVRFEICYAAGVNAGDALARRSVISNATQLIRSTRGKGIVISSEARRALGCRAPADVINLANVWGLGQEKGKEAVCEEARKVVVLAQMKRSSYRGVVEVIYGGEQPERTSKADKQGGTEFGKKRKIEAGSNIVEGEQKAPSKRELKRQAAAKRAKMNATKDEHAGTADADTMATARGP